MPNDTVDLSLLGAAAIGRCSEAVPLLLAAGVPVQLKDVNRAVMEGSVEVLEALLQAGQPRVHSDGIELSWLDEAWADPMLQVGGCWV